MAVSPMMVVAYYHPSQKAAISGELDEFGIVTFAVFAASDSPIRGTMLFLRMMNAFGSDATAIQGVWRKGQRPSINIDKVNELTAKGTSIDDAVLQAWTVTRARKLGFTKVSVVRHEGSPGNYRKIDVLIEI
jgi:hypothetical protein